MQGIIFSTLTITAFISVLSIISQAKGNLCPANEIFTECGSACPPTCKNVSQQNTACPAVCVKGCFCKDGFVRNNENVCIQQDQCKKETVCPTNEVFSECGSACAPTCDNLHELDQIGCADVCVEGCFCKDGLVRNNQGTCVPPQQCKKDAKCGPNEIPGCAQPADCQTCENKQICQTYVCNPGCICRPGFYRQEGICIPEASCPNPSPVCPPNENYLECGSACPPTCNNLPQFSFLACPAVCVEGCFCKDGFVRNSQNICVPPQQCKKDTKCGLNEIPGCWQPSECQTCENKQLCPTFVCNPGCICRPGFYRQEGICIPEASCPNPSPVCPPNENYLECGSACPPTCDNLHKLNSLSCPAICVEGCFCKDGLVRNSQNICVPPQQCKKDTKCGLNEIPGCWQPPECQTCENKQLCPTFVCNPGCICRPGFYRQEGICIPEASCPNPIVQPPICPMFEVFSNGGSFCEGCPPRCLALNLESKCYCEYPFARIEGICRPMYECYI